MMTFLLICFFLLSLEAAAFEACRIEGFDLGSRTKMNLISIIRSQLFFLSRESIRWAPSLLLEVKIKLLV
jgi:hypothetical protein